MEKISTHIVILVLCLFVTNLKKLTNASTTTVNPTLEIVKSSLHPMGNAVHVRKYSVDKEQTTNDTNGMKLFLQDTLDQSGVKSVVFRQQYLKVDGTFVAMDKPPLQVSRFADYSENGWTYALVLTAWNDPSPDRTFSETNTN